MGIYTVSVTNGPHFAPIIGGYIAQRLGWRWAFWIPGIILAGLWFVFLFAFPETLFSRVDQNKINEQSYARRLLFHGKVLDRKLRARDFLLSLRMVQYIAVAITALWYCTANAYGSPIFSLTGAYVAEDVWGFDVEQVGLFLGVPQTVGCFLGEMNAGWVSDMMMQTYAKRHNGYFKAEVRLWLLPFCVLLPIGTATYGYCVQYHRHWIEAAVCMATAGFGLQVGTTMVYLYCTDSYKAQSGEIGVVMNLFKSGKHAMFFHASHSANGSNSLCIQHWFLRARLQHSCRIRCWLCHFRGYQCGFAHPRSWPSLQRRGHSSKARRT